VTVVAHVWFLAMPVLLVFGLGVLAERWRRGREDDREADERLRFANRPMPAREVCHYCGRDKKWAIGSDGCTKAPLGAHTWVDAPEGANRKPGSA
jgi:hypothetical protein